MSDQSLSGQAIAREPPPPPRSFGQRLRGLLPSLIAATLAVALAALFIVNWDRWVGGAGLHTTTDAYLQADLTPLSSQASGQIVSVPVQDFARVKAGQLLVQIDDAPYQAALAQADANVAAAQAAIENIQAQEQLQGSNISAAQAQLEGVQATDLRNELEAHRQHALLATRIVGTEQAVEQADAAWGQSRAQVLQSQSSVQAAQRQLKVQQTQEGLLRANLQAAQAARALAAINLGYTRITAPNDGMVSQRRVYRGQYVGIGTQVISVVPLPHVYVIANYKETQLTHLTIAQPATIRVDTFPDLRLHGHVIGWSPATGAQFALLPPDNATGNFTKIIQRIPVKISIDDDAGLGDSLRPGMSVESTIDTSAQPGSDTGNNP